MLIPCSCCSPNLFSLNQEQLQNNPLPSRDARLTKNRTNTYLSNLSMAISIHENDNIKNFYEPPAILNRMIFLVFEIMRTSTWPVYRDGDGLCMQDLVDAIITKNDDVTIAKGFKIVIFSWSQ